MRTIKKLKIPELHFLKPVLEKHPSNGMQLEFLEKQDAVAALLLNHDASQVFLVKQYRPGMGEEIYEIPAGLIEKNENPKDACMREIQEETGYYPSNYDILYESPSALCVSPGYTEEKLYFYIFQLKHENIQPKALHLDEGEELEGKWFPREQLAPNSLLPISQDLKTVFAYLLWNSLYSK